MSQAKSGDRVRVHYTGTLADGTQFDSSRDREPLEFTLGEGQIIDGFEQTVIGMEPGETRTAELGPGDAYGERRDELLVDVDRGELPDDLDPQVGQTLQLRDDEGRSFVVHVAEVGDDSIKLDANHPLAGHDLQFEIELVEIV